MEYPEALQREAEQAREVWERLLIGYTPVSLRVAARAEYERTREAFNNALSEYNRQIP